MTFVLYNIVLYLSVPILLLLLFVRSLRAPDYRLRIRERFGFLPDHINDDYIWVHSVSVGETVAAVPLVKTLLEQYPDQRVLITTMTPTGSEQVLRSFGDQVDHVYAPYDLRGSVKRFLQRTKPRILIIMETELWPNLLIQCDKLGIPAVLVNARLSEGSAAGYARAPSVSKLMLDRLSAVAVQDVADGERFIELGLQRNKLTVTGSIKFDYTIEPQVKEATAQLRELWQGASRRPIWIAASTHQGEDDIILDAHKQLLLQKVPALLILVPRHPERFDDVYRLCQQSNFNVARRSSQDAVEQGTQIVLGDTMGELAAMYGACDIALVGGSLIDTGGHNPIEPAAWGVPVLCGVHMFNFTEITKLLLERGGLTLVANAEQIAEQVQSILTNEEAHKQAGLANRQVVEENRGATERQFNVVKRFLS